MAGQAEPSLPVAFHFGSLKSTVLECSHIPAPSSSDSMGHMHRHRQFGSICQRFCSTFAHALTDNGGGGGGDVARGVGARGPMLGRAIREG